ncbi:MAG: RHS repeat-associated core domain-containing protein, partial [Caulobacteraceae bacterium]|nr:RHS repeat-associated core domain-containing protein [Caulobacteraceae bacterium]
AYVYTPASTAVAYVNNMLNRLTSINGSTVGYDGRGNITSAPGATYGYNAENQMTSSSTSMGSATYAYDSTGRLYQSNGSITRRYVYDGQQVIAEYDGSGVIQGRYVPGLGLDDVVVSYDAGGNRSWWLSDERRSVVALTNGSGAAFVTNTYDEYGVPGASNAGLFQYTGQMWLPDAQLYHYRARTYAPQIGRFMQTDPLGYGAGANIYAYVGGDPMNWVDPLGLEKQCVEMVDLWINRDTGKLFTTPAAPVCMDTDAYDLGEVVVTGVRKVQSRPQPPAPPPPPPAPPPSEPSGPRTHFACGDNIPGGNICGPVTEEQLCADAKHRIAFINALLATDTAIVGVNGVVKQFSKGIIARLLAAEMAADQIDVFMYCH